MTITKRGNSFHLRKRVPRRYQSVETRGVVWISLHTDSESIAKVKAPGAWAHLVEGWEARLAGDTSDAERRFDAARNLAAVRGFRYLPVDKVADLPIAELRARLDAAKGRDGEPDMREAAAVLGGTEDLPSRSRGRWTCSGRWPRTNRWVSPPISCGVGSGRFRWRI